MGKEIMTFGNDEIEKCYRNPFSLNMWILIKY